MIFESSFFWQIFWTSDFDDFDREQKLWKLACWEIALLSLLSIVKLYSSLGTRNIPKIPNKTFLRITRYWDTKPIGTLVLGHPNFMRPDSLCNVYSIQTVASVFGIVFLSWNSRERGMLRPRRCQCLRQKYNNMPHFLHSQFKNTSFYDLAIVSHRRTQRKRDVTVSSTC